MIAGLFFSFMFLGIPFAAASLFYSRKGFKQLRDEGRSKIGLIIIIIVALLEIIGGIAWLAAPDRWPVEGEEMTPRKRKLLGRNAGVMLREAVFETADAIESESREGYEVTRKRVLFEEVLLVTIHREMGALYVISMAAATIIFAGIAILGRSEPAVAISLASSRCRSSSLAWSGWC